MSTELNQQTPPASQAQPSPFRGNHENREFPSPKKKARIGNRKDLQKMCGKGRRVFIGEILKLPTNANAVLRRGDTKNVKLRCTVIDNRTGRLPGNEDVRSGRRFICIADYTGYMSLGMIASETNVNYFDVPSNICQSGTRCFFSAEITGTIAWIPTRGNPSKPTFFLNDGNIRKLDVSNWKADLGLSFPTTDVCLGMKRDPFSTSTLHTTTGFCGKIDISTENSDSDVLLALEDPVGYSAVEIDIDDYEGSLEEYVDQNGLLEGNYIFLSGEIAIEKTANDVNALLRTNSQKVKVSVASSAEYHSYVKALLDTSHEWFHGNKPESM